ncbi:MAG: aminotransferase class IV [Nitriliruptoraceae bacterium]
MPASEATVPLTDDGFLRGDAVFEAVLVRQGRTHILEAHLARLRRSANKLGIRVPVLRHVVADLLAAWGERDGVMRLIVTRAGTVRGLMETVRHPETISLHVLDIPWRSALTGVKTLSYAVNQWAIREARAHDADDALIMSDDTVLELPTGSICAINGDRVSAPDPGQLPILDSATLLELSTVIDIDFRILRLDDIRDADEVFVVSATRPVLAVHAIVTGDDQYVYEAPGPATQQIRERFDEHINNTVDVP